MVKENPLPGLTIISNFITPQEEETLLKDIQKEEWDTRLKRWTQHYGYEYQYTSRTITKDNYLGELPKWSNFVTEKIKKTEYFDKEINQIIVNRYLPGEGIYAHIDVPTIFGNTIYSLSLESGCIMTFTKGSESVDCYLNPRSLLIMTGDARYKWKHEIKTRTVDKVGGRKVKRGTRVSLTLRTAIIS